MPIRQFDEVVKGLADRSVAELVNVSLPGVVLSYDIATQTATVRPVVRESFEEDDEIYSVDFEPIPQVPVAHWRAGSFALHAPLKPGDFVTLVVQDRSIDEFMYTGSTDVTPQSLRRFDWTDAVALPMPPAPTPIEGLLEDGLVLGSDTTSITMTEAGQIKIEAAGDELLLTLSDLIDQLVVAVSGAGSPSFNPAAQAALSIIKSRINAMRAT